MAVEQKVTYCRICEPLCGLIATVEDGRLQSLRPDPDHPLSQGRPAPRASRSPTSRTTPTGSCTRCGATPTGEFERVTWDEALDDIAARLKRT